MRVMSPLLALVAFLLLLGIPAPAPSDHPPEDIVIDAAKDKRAEVKFPHKVHMEKVESCTTCHHTQEDLTATSGIEVKTCTSCHLDPEKPEIPSMREMSLKKNPLHSGCIDCHKEQKVGPTKCDDCHPKE